MSRETYFRLAIVWTGLILVIVFLASVPDDESWLRKQTRTYQHVDKVLHFVLLGIWAFLLNKTFPDGLLGCKVLTVVAVIEEFSQIFITLRQFDWLDLVFGLAGIWLIGGLARIGATPASPSPPSADTPST